MRRRSRRCDSESGKRTSSARTGSLHCSSVATYWGSTSWNERALRYGCARMIGISLSCRLHVPRLRSSPTARSRPIRLSPRGGHCICRVLPSVSSRRLRIRVETWMGSRDHTRSRRVDTRTHSGIMTCRRPLLAGLSLHEGEISRMAAPRSVQQLPWRRATGGSRTLGLRFSRHGYETAALTS